MVAFPIKLPAELSLHTSNIFLQNIHNQYYSFCNGDTNQPVRRFTHYYSTVMQTQLLVQSTLDIGFFYSLPLHS